MMMLMLCVYLRRRLFQQPSLTLPSLDLHLHRHGCPSSSSSVLPPPCLDLHLHRQGCPSTSSSVPLLPCLDLHLHHRGCPSSNSSSVLPPLCLDLHLHPHGCPSSSSSNVPPLVQALHCRHLLLKLRCCLLLTIIRNLPHLPHRRPLRLGLLLRT